MYPDSKEIPSVSVVCRFLNEILNETLQRVVMQGEISEFTHYRGSGHWYFTIKDDLAQVSCVMFARDNSRVTFTPKIGDHVAVSGRFSFYEKGGRIQCIVSAIRKAGAGMLYEQFLRIKKKLQEEGLFQESVKRPIPRVPKTIGIVTGLQTAALRDALIRLQDRAPYASIIVYPTAVQGLGAELEIASAIDKASQRAETDVLLLIRGGGSIEDLWAFNEEIVARAIRSSHIPVITGIGHESDVTIADLVADLRAATPTAAAEASAMRRTDLLTEVQTQMALLKESFNRSMDNRLITSDLLSRTFVSASSLTNVFLSRHDCVFQTLQNEFVENVYLQRNKLHGLMLNLQTKRPTISFDQIALYTNHLSKTVSLLVQGFENSLTRNTVKLEVLNPNDVLKRGYTWVEYNGQVLGSLDDLNVGQYIKIQFVDGTVNAQIDSISKKLDAS
ncbi:MAG: exodeoxyribonuclease VII large subunit [Burkholderiaceae bacterium]|nr:exodeoxyribonuclease VII large subunit [Burkholderiaceae bacterium]